MLVNPNARDLNYQPAVKPSTYIPPKVSIFKKLGLFVLNTTKKPSLFVLNIFKKIFSLKTIFMEFELLAIALFFLALFAGVMLVLNYFNILSISELYPKYFSVLPHRYDVLANKSALSNTPYGNSSQESELEAKLYAANSDTISVYYKGKVVEFVQNSQFFCLEKTGKNVFTAICSDVFDNKNKDKNVTVDYFQDEKSGIYYATRLLLLN